MNIKCAYTKLIPINEITYHPKNPNKHSDAQISRLSDIIKYNGIRHPVIISSISNYVIAGHGRLESMKLLGITEVPCDVQEFQNEAEEYQFMVADNAIASWSDLDIEDIKNQIQEINFKDYDMLGINNLSLDFLGTLDPLLDETEKKVLDKILTCPECGHKFLS